MVVGLVSSLLSLLFVYENRFDRQVTSALGFNPKVIKRLNPDTSTVRLTNGGNDVSIEIHKETEVSPQRHESENDGISLSHALTSGELEATRKKDYGDVKCLILDLSFCSFLDTDGATVLQQLYKALNELRIKFFLSNCNGKKQGIFCNSSRCADRIEFTSIRLLTQMTATNPNDTL